MKKILPILVLAVLLSVPAFASDTNNPLALKEWLQGSDTSVIWLVGTWWGNDGGGVDSDLGPIIMEVPKSEWDALPDNRKKKVYQFFEKLEKHQEKATRVKVAAWLASLPNDFNMHVYFCRDESKSITGAIKAGNAADSRPALVKPIPIEP